MLFAATEPVTEEAAAAGLPSGPCLARIEPGRSFLGADVRAGHWRSFFVGIVGEVSLSEDEMMWPNQVVHGERTVHNLRGMPDLAAFLADAAEEDVAGHLRCLDAIAAERGYPRRWCWHRLRERWGLRALRRLGVRRRDVVHGRRGPLAGEEPRPDGRSLQQEEQDNSRGAP